jgi:hypothetical protein
MILAFLAGMLCGAALLVAVILVSDRSFLDLITGRLADDSSAAAEPAKHLEDKAHRRVAVGSDS